MDDWDILTYVICFAIGIIGVATQRKKKVREMTMEEPVLPSEEASDETVGTDFIPIRTRSKAKQPSPHKANPHKTSDRKPQETEKREETGQDYGIHSAEEARQAVIWSEILRRKY